LGIEKKSSFIITDRVEGEAVANILLKKRDKGFDIEKYGEGAIFYRTSSPDILLVESPQIEVLHKAVEPYSLGHLKNELRNLSKQYDALIAINESRDREEKFVHALSILWLRQYNKNRSLGFNEQEIDDRFAEYEKDIKYKGVNNISQHIANIGIKKAIELYVTAPDELFNVLK